MNKEQIVKRIETAEAILAPYRVDMDRYWQGQDAPPWDPAPEKGIADRLCRAYCFAMTGFANYTVRPESHGWYWLAREAREALQLADDSDDAVAWVYAKVGALETAAEIASEIK